MANPGIKKNMHTAAAQKKRKQTMAKRAAEGLPSTSEKVFAEAWVRTRNIKEAAEIAGYKQADTFGHQLFNRPRVKRYIDSILAAVEKQEVARASSEIIEERKEAKVTRTDVLKRLWELANMDPLLTGRTISGQVKATDSLAEILGMKIKQIRDVTQTFDGWTDDELEAYATSGTVPERFRK